MWQAVKSIDHIFYDMFKKLVNAKKLAKKKDFPFWALDVFPLHTLLSLTRKASCMSGGSQLTVRVLESDIELKRDRPIKEFFREM